ncbi:MAG TPA: translation factor Sua5, partial [Sulfitobacter sp.]|nr:translation factor Sua5 [Sulfitobacter sp.]
MTETLPPTAQGIARAARLLQEGALVALPTETVYGLGADARNGEAVAGIYAAKGRP